MFRRVLMTGAAKLALRPMSRLVTLSGALMTLSERRSLLLNGSSAMPHQDLTLENALDSKGVLSVAKLGGQTTRVKNTMCV